MTRRASNEHPRSRHWSARIIPAAPNMAEPRCSYLLLTISLAELVTMGIAKWTSWETPEDRGYCVPLSPDVAMDGVYI